MVFALALRDEERVALRKTASCKVGRVSERMRVDSALGAWLRDAPDIAHIFECDEATLRQWIAHFEAGGLPALRDRPKAGRWPRATPASRERIERGADATRPAGRGHDAGGDRKRGIFGALTLEGPCPGAWHYCVAERMRAVEFLAFLEQIAAGYPTHPLYLVLDNANIHTAKLTHAWFVEHQQVTLCSPPSYAGHRENPVEKVWWRMKQEVTANRLYGDIKKVVAAVDAFFGTFTSETALRLAA